MGSIGDKRVKGSTILETLVALTILLVLFAIATSLLVQVSLSGYSEKKLKAVRLLEKWSIETRIEKSYFNEDTAVDGYWLKRAVEVYKGGQPLLSLHYTAFGDNKQLLADWKELVVNESK